MNLRVPKKKAGNVGQLSFDQLLKDSYSMELPCMELGVDMSYQIAQEGS
jgi:hypothetical protein